MKIGLNDKLLSKALTEGKGQLPFNFDFGKLTKIKADLFFKNFQKIQSTEMWQKWRKNWGASWRQQTKWSHRGSITSSIEICKKIND